MTAQRLGSSPSSDSLDKMAFKEALQLKTKHNQQFTADAVGASEPDHIALLKVANSVPSDTADEDRVLEEKQQQQQLQQQQQQQRPGRHQRLTVVTDTDTDSRVPPTGAAFSSEHDAGAAAQAAGIERAAILVSPPSSPKHVVTSHAQEGQAEVPPPAASPAAGAAVGAPAAAAVALGACPAAPSVVAPFTPPGAPIRLGRGRKLCPNCKATAKSAVKQCGACKHVFSPASSKLRTQLHRTSKESEEELLVVTRRRHRPSQRLLESLVESAGVSGVGEGAVAPAAVAHAQRPPASFESGGDLDQRVISVGGNGGRSAVGSVASGASPKTADGWSGQRKLEQQQQNPPKRSHKRKVPLPLGVSPPKRKKGAAATARMAAVAAAQAVQAAAKTAAHPVPHAVPATALGNRLTLPEQQRVAQDLISSPAPLRHTVPESPELAPMASPAGPLLFLSTSASHASCCPCPLEDEAEWVSRGGGGCGGASGVAYGGGGGYVGSSGVYVGSGSNGYIGGGLSPAATFVQQQHLQQQGEQLQQQRYVPGAAISLRGLLFDDSDGPEDEEEHRQQQQQPLSTRRQRSVGIDLDTSTEDQDKDLFPDLDLWWKGADEGAVTAAVVDSAAATPAAVMGGASLSSDIPVAFSTLGDRDESAVQQHVELLGDMEDVLLWNSIRSSPVGEIDGDATAAAPSSGLAASAAAASAGKSLSLWPGASNNDSSLLMLPSSSSSSSLSSSVCSSFFRGNRCPPAGVPVFPNFERGAAIASAVGLNGGRGGAPAAPDAGERFPRALSDRTEFMLAEASCSSLPEPLAFGDGGGMAVSTVSADSSDGGEAPRF